MTRHALRTLVKQGHAGALEMLGYRGDVPVSARLEVGQNSYRIGERLELACTLEAAQDLPVMVDYRMVFARAQGKTAEKVFKLKVAKITGGAPLTLKKAHPLKGDASTFTLHPGAHRVILQVNGVDVAAADFDLSA